MRYKGLIFGVTGNVIHIFMNILWIVYIHMINIYVYTDICIYLYIFIFIYTHIHTVNGLTSDVNFSTYIFIYIYIHIYIYICIYNIHIYIHVYIYIYMCIYILTFIYTHIHIGNGLTSDVNHFLNAGADKILIKPLDMKVFNAAMKEKLGY
jgi:hypothetical protein